MALHKLIALIAIIAIFSSVACTSDSDEENLLVGTKPAGSSVAVSIEDQETAEARVIVTKDFGQVLLLDKTVELTSSLSALEALKKVAIVETKYGGGFVHDINDTRSNSSSGGKDWFVYFNGIQSKTGAGSYTLNPGDVQYWDFHDWGFRQFIPCIIGNFPEPFVHGYGGKVWPTVVVYDEGFEPEADKLVAVMREFGIKNITTESMDELPKDEKKSSNLVLLGDSQTELISELDKVWERMGFFAHFKEGRLLVEDSNGELSNEYGQGAGLIQATQNPWNSKGLGVCENVVWMVTGTDETGVRRALDAFINQYEEFKYAFAVVVDESGVNTIPGLS